MNNEQIQSLIKQLTATGLNEEEIMNVFYETFQKGELDRKDLEALAEAMGFDLTDDFKNDPQPDPVAAGEGVGDVSKETLEGAKEIEPGQNPEDFKQEIEGVAPVPTPSEGSEEKPEDESTAKEGEEQSNGISDEDKDWDEAQKLFKI